MSVSFEKDIAVMALATVSKMSAPNPMLRNWMAV